MHPHQLTAHWYISTSLSVKYDICLNGFSEMRTGPMYVWKQGSRVEHMMILLYTHQTMDPRASKWVTNPCNPEITDSSEFSVTHEVHL